MGIHLPLQAAAKREVPESLVARFDAWSAEYDRTVLSLQGPYAEVFRGYRQILDRVTALVLSSLPSAGGVGQALGNSPLRVLDIGTGTGNLAQVFQQKGLRVEAVDPSPAMRSIAQAKLPGVRVRPGHFLSLPYLGSTFDAVASSFALHHVPPVQLPAALQELRRVLKPRGVAVVADIAFPTQVERARLIQRLLAEGNLQLLEGIRREYMPLVPRLIRTAEGAGFSCRAEQLTEWVWAFCLARL
ncbi:MAG: methyltransferase domain-containing protein [Bacillota bacterium]|nr:methyltransferase domain-containing protein [Bacillota bacterium]